MWIYAINGQNVGPVSFEEIVNQIQAGTISQQTVVCEIGQKPCRAGQNPKLQGYFSSTNTQTANFQPSAKQDVKSIPKPTTVPKTGAKTQKKSSFPIVPIAIAGSVCLILAIVAGLFLVSGKKKNVDNPTPVASAKVTDSSKEDSDVASANVTEPPKEEKEESQEVVISEEDLNSFSFDDTSKETPEEKLEEKQARETKEKENTDDELSKYTNMEDCFNQAVKYRDGDGVEQDSDKSLQLFEKAAQLGHLQAQFTLGDYYLDKYAEILKKFGRNDECKKNAAKALYWYSEAANHGHVDAQDTIGMMYDMGVGVEKDSEKAIYWYKKAANNGKVETQCILGSCYTWGLEVGGREISFDRTEGISWYTKAANNGYAKAQYNLGLIYYKYGGFGRIEKRKDAIEEGLKWMKKAADQGYKDAIEFYNLKSKNLVSNTQSEIKTQLQDEEPEPDDPNRFVQKINGIPFVYRWCPAGEFMMGSPEDEEDRAGIEKQHKVKLSKGFWILETEVTYDHFLAITGKNLGRASNTMNYPVENVSWDDCIAFCQMCKEKGMEVKLPTEAQWEYACRAGTKSAFAGNFESLTCYLDNSGGHACRVKEYSANSWKIYGMHGNVAEWCADWGGPYKLEDQTDPTGPGKGTKRVTRGGSWGSSRSFCRSAFRGSLEPNKKTPGLGFRLILLGHDKEE